MSVEGIKIDIFIKEEIIFSAYHISQSWEDGELKLSHTNVSVSL